MITRLLSEYNKLSNFYPYNVTYNGITYRCSEAAFQAQKCADIKKRELFAH